MAEIVSVIQWKNAAFQTNLLRAIDESGNGNGPFTPIHALSSGLGVVAAVANLSPLATSYTNGKIVAQSATAGDCSAIAVPAAPFNGQLGSLTRLRLKMSETTWLNKSIRVHVHETAPVFSAGAGSDWAGNVSDSGWCGSFDVMFQLLLSDGVKGIATPNEGQQINFSPASNSQNVYLTFQALGSVTVVDGSLAPQLEVTSYP